MNSPRKVFAPARLEILWFEFWDGFYWKMIPVRQLPLCAAHATVKAMEAEGYRFVQLGSSQLPL
jgi:hypothetical protein